MTIEQSRKLALENAIAALCELNVEENSIAVTDLIYQLQDVITERVSA